MKKKWFTRFEQQDVDPQYLVNMEDATNYFMSWFSGRHAASFNDMLMSMHRLVSRHGYSGYTNTDEPLVPFTSQFRGVNKEAWRPLLRKEWFTSVKISVDGNIYPTFPRPTLHMSHHLVNRPGGYELHLPDEKHVPVFLDEMATAMMSLSKEMSPTVLANYIQYFVVGHPFERINFSICMAQTNAILSHYGFEPLYHEWFDFECFVYDYDRLEEMFLNRMETKKCQK